MSKPCSVLIVDDDASHLKLYSLLLEGGGFAPVPLLVKGATLEIPKTRFQLAVVDYKLGVLTALDVVKELKKASKPVPILLLTDMMWMPDDVKPFVAAYVRKGDPDHLLEVLGRLTKQSKPA
ncbi:MAG: hypothetical protein ACJ71N_06395 [Terriglobales bacterium]